MLYKAGTQEGIPNLLDLTAEVVFARADRLPSTAAGGMVNGSAIKVLDQVCCVAAILDSRSNAACFLMATYDVYQTSGRCSHAAVMLVYLLKVQRRRHGIN